MTLIMAGALFLLAVARIPAMLKTRNDAVFLAAVFAGTSSLLIGPEVYLPVDRVLGSINLTKLALNSFMIAGLWYLRSAVISAVSPGGGPHSPWIRRLPLIVALVLQAVFFFLAGLRPSTAVWNGSGDSPLATALFSAMMPVFIAWSCGEIAWACLKYVPAMRQSFRIGFTMVGAGSLIAVLAMADMTVRSFGGVFPSPITSRAAPPWFAVVEMISVTLVGLGLTIPALAGRITRRQAAVRLERTITKVEEIRQHALRNVDMGRILKPGADATAQDRLHRMLVEIWDAELAAGEGRSVLSPEDREYILLVESDFDLERTR
ncbi:MAG TPA: hypothetical protein VF867_16575 [Arthrobacter sp.]